MRTQVALLAVAVSGCTPAAAVSDPPTHRTITLFHTADIHSHLFSRELTIGARDAALGLGTVGETALVGGAARLGGLLERERARSETSFTLDSGDLLEGSAVFSAFHGVPETLSAEALSLDAQAVGNHDLSRGAAALAELRAGRATFPLLASNLEDLVLPGVARLSIVIERNGTRLAVIGLGRAPTGAVDLDACAEAVARAIAGMNPGVDAVVVLSHLGRDSDIALVPKTEGVDVILGGHTHDVLDPPKTVLGCGAAVRARSRCHPKPVTVVHSGAYGRYVGRVDLALSSDPVDVMVLSDGRRSAVVDARFALLPVNEAVPERTDIVDLLAPYRDALVEGGLENPVAFAPAPVSRSKPARGDSALGNFVTHAMRMAAGADVALINATGIRADLPEGELSVDDFFEILPFEDALVSLDVSGDDLARAIRDVARGSCDRDRVSQAELDGATLLLDCAASGTAEIAIGIDTFQPGRTYRVAAASFLVEGGQWLDGRGTVVERGRPIRDIVIGAARSGRPCVAPGAVSSLPCVDATSGAVVDGRISWR